MVMRIVIVIIVVVECSSNSDSDRTTGLGAGARRGTNWVGTIGVTASLSLLTEGLFGYSR